MTTLTNMLRDLVHVDLGAAQHAFGTEDVMTNQNAKMNGSGIVYQTQGSASHAHDSVNGTSAANRWRASGLLMSQPIVDATPYRVKAYVWVANMNLSLFVGYGPTNPTGSDDQINKCVQFPLTAGAHDENGIFDDIILIPGLTQQDPDFGRPIAFGIGVSGSSGGTCRFNLSVQNLAKTAPQFAASMS